MNKSKILFHFKTPISLEIHDHVAKFISTDHYSVLKQKNFNDLYLFNMTVKWYVHEKLQKPIT